MLRPKSCGWASNEVKRKEAAAVMVKSLALSLLFARIIFYAVRLQGLVLQWLRCVCLLS